MSVIHVNTVVTNLELVREYYTHIKVYRSTTGEEGAYTEITDGSTRPAFEDGRTVYRYSDENGSSDYWYRTSYYHGVSGAESSLSDAQQGEGDAALDIITVTELKELFLFGLDLTDDAGNPYPQSLYEHFIRSAVSQLEHKLDIPLTPTRYVDESHDFMRQDYEKFIWLEADHYPIIDIESLGLYLPGNNLVQDFELDWLQVEKEFGQIQVVPGPASAGTVLLGFAGAWLPLLYTQNRVIPRAFRMTYTAGFPAGQVPPVIKDVVGKVASFGPLNIAGDLLGGAGIASQSISVDSLNQNFNTTSSATNAGYGARLLQYSRELKDAIPMLHRHYHGPRLRVA